jgi:alpha-L-fucosidase
MLRFTFLVVLVVCQALSIVAQSLPKPTPRQLAWQQLETTAFLHFTVNTYTDKEWGDGTESPQIFNPVNFDADKLVGILKETGFKLVIITAKHHDGFCLWPSKITNHTVANSPWKQGKGDVVKEIADACKRQGLKFGFYLSPWDQHEPTYGTAKYNDFYKTQLRELLTNYGEVSEVWLDGAKGKNAKDMEYDFNGYWALVRQLQPKAVLFSDVGPDVRWVGNEAGNAGETCWSTINTTGMAPGKADSKYLNTGDPNGSLWIPAETDVSIRPGWFYHAAEDNKVKTGKQLVNLYYQSVGRNSLLLLNIPPNRQGLFSDPDIASLREFRAILNETFKTNYLANQKSNISLTDTKLNTYITLPQGQSIVFNLAKPTSFDRAMFQENIAQGQRNETALLEYWDGAKWQKINQFTTIGYKRLLRFPPVQTDKIRLTIIKAKGPVQLAEVGLFKASAKE